MMTPVVVEENRFMHGLRRCPECGRQQYAIIITVTNGYPDTVMCKYCLARFKQSDNPIIPWNKGLRDPNAKCRDKDYARKAAHERYWSDPEYYRAKARERTKTAKYRETRRKYERLPHVKAMRAAYAKTEKGKEIRRTWKKSNQDKVKRINVRCCQRALARLAANQDDEQHGTNTGYTYGCRCDRCKKAHSDKQKAYYARKRMA